MRQKRFRWRTWRSSSARAVARLAREDISPPYLGSSMTYDARRICPLCAWRANCAKRFSRGDDATLHCPDFSQDVSLRPRDSAGKPLDPKD